MDNLFTVLLMYVWMLSCYLIISKVIFPIFTVGLKRKDLVVYNVPLIIDLFELLVLFAVLVLGIIAAFNPWTWDNLYFLPVFIVYTLLVIVTRISKMDGEIIIRGNEIIIKENKNSTPQKFVLNRNNVTFEKYWNNENLTGIAKWKKAFRVHYLDINGTVFNLEELGLENYAIDIMRTIKKQTGNNNIDKDISAFERYYGTRWIYVITFAVISVYIYNNWVHFSELNWF